MHRASTQKLGSFAFIAAVLVACSGGRGGGDSEGDADGGGAGGARDGGAIPPEDAAGPDGEARDGAGTEGAFVDASESDGSGIDGSTSDASMSDASDASTTDGGAEGDAADASTTDAGSTDAGPACAAHAWPVDRGPTGGACPVNAPASACTTCLRREDTYCDIACPTGTGYTLCVDSKSDPRHCGACGNVCAAGTTCVEGACVSSTSLRFIDGLRTPRDLVDDAKNIYFTDDGTNEVWQADKATGAATKLASGQGRPYRIAIDATHVYWTNQDGGIARAPIGGGGLAETIHAAVAPVAIAVDATDVFWSTGTGVSGDVYKAPKDPKCARAASRLSSYGPQHYLLLDETRLYGWTTNTGGVLTNPSVFGIHKDTGARTAYAGAYDATVSYATGVGVDATTVFFFDEKGSGVVLFEKEKNTGAMLRSRQLAPSGGLDAPYTRIAADRCGVYWVYGGTGVAASVYRVMPTDTRARRLSWAGSTTSVTDGRAIAVDDRHVYWADAGFIGRIPNEVRVRTRSLRQIRNKRVTDAT